MVLTSQKMLFYLKVKFNTNINTSSNTMINYYYYYLFMLSQPRKLCTLFHIRFCIWCHIFISEAYQNFHETMKLTISVFIGVMRHWLVSYGIPIDFSVKQMFVIDLKKSIVVIFL